MTSFQDRLEALLQELPDTDALEESLLKKAARFKITANYSRKNDPNIPIDDTLRNVVEAMQEMFGGDENLSYFDDRNEHPLPPYYGELADTLIHTDLVCTIMEELAWDGLLLLFVNNHGSQLTRWRDDLRRLKSPLSKCFDEAYMLVFDLLNKSADIPGPGGVRNLDLDAQLTNEIQEQIAAIDDRMEQQRGRSYLRIARQYRDAIEPFL